MTHTLELQYMKGFIIQPHKIIRLFFFNVCGNHMPLSEESDIKFNKRISSVCYRRVESQLSDLNGTEGWLDNQKCLIIQKTNEKYEDKYQLNL
jgi:hypothetical protein